MEPDRTEESGVPPGSTPRRPRRPRDAKVGLERVAEVHYCRSDAEANQYLALGPEWDLQEIVPMRSVSPDGQEQDAIHYIVVRWENDADRERLSRRDVRLRRES